MGTGQDEMGGLRVDERWRETTLRRAAKTRMVKVRTTTATLERMNMARAGWGQIGADVRRWVLGWTRRGAQTEEGVDAVPHEVAGGEEEVADGGKEGDDGQDVHDAEVADGCRAVIGLARTHQRGRFVLGKHSVHSGWKREMEKKGKGKSKEHQETAKQNITETTTVTRR